MSRLEGSVEKSFKRWINKVHPWWLYLKFAPPGTNGYPDRILVGPRGLVLFIEWKRKGKGPRALQVERIKDLRRLEQDVQIWDDLEKAKSEFRHYLRSKGLSDGSD